VIRNQEVTFRNDVYIVDKFCISLNKLERNHNQFADSPTTMCTLTGAAPKLSRREAARLGRCVRRTGLTWTPSKLDLIQRPEGDSYSMGEGIDIEKEKQTRATT
jgi:hypothetical protein